MRVIGADGGQLGVLDTSEALRIAEEGGLDLVEVSPKAMPPVCKIMDYGKFKYEDSKKRKDAKKHQSTVTYKEIKFRPKTDEHDFEFKVKHIRRFLSEGNKARLVVIFRGREIVHPETGQAMLKKVVELTSDIAHGRAAADDGRAAHADDHRAAWRRRSAVRRGSPGARRRRPGAGHAVAVRAVAVRAVAGAFRARHRRRPRAPRPAAPSSAAAPAPRPARPSPLPKPAPTSCRSSLPQSNQRISST